MIGTKKLFPKVYHQIATRPTISQVIQKSRRSIHGKLLPWKNILTCHITFVRSISSVQKEFSRSFHHLQHQRSHRSNLLIPSQIKCHRDLIDNLPTNFWFGQRNESSESKKRIPKLIALQNPLTWLMIKIDFTLLRQSWDPSFQEKEFKFGTKQAISRVTQVISDGQLRDLNGLLTKAAKASLLRDLDSKWTQKQRSLLALYPDNIQISLPKKVHFIKIADKKFCDVDMSFLALKWAPINSLEALIYTEIFAKFHRDYTLHSIPEWTIAFFKVIRFQAIRVQK